MLEYSRAGASLHGVVSTETPSGPLHSVRLQLISDSEVSPDCTCGVERDVWCEHSVALLWRAADAGFLDSADSLSLRGGVAGSQGRGAEELATALIDASQLARSSSIAAAYLPEVELLLELSGDKIGAQIKFDGVIQPPAIVRRTSARALDNLLLELLEQNGYWDEEKLLWYVSASSDIEALLGFAQEYDTVKTFGNQTPLSFSREELQVLVKLRWLESGAELALYWAIPPEGREVLKEGDLIGSGPYWTYVQGTLYRVSDAGSRLATLFTHGGVVAVPRAGVGPVLEALMALEGKSHLIQVLNPERQPKSVVSIPTPKLELERRHSMADQFQGIHGFEVSAQLEFEYALPSNPHEVQLPNRAYEAECADLLKQLGFQSPGGIAGRRYLVTSDRALDLVHGGDKLFPAHWKVSGLEQIARGVRFAQLGLSISIGSGLDKADSPAKSGSIDWFDCHVTLQQNNANVPLSHLFRNIRSEADRWIRLDSGAYAQVPGGGVRSLKTTLGLLDPNFRMSNSIKTKLSAAQALSFSAIQDSAITISSDSRLKALSRRFVDFGAIEQLRPSKKFQGTLRHYQEEGVSWMNFLHEFEFGGILADEMGLGKTVQALALLQKLKSKRSKSKAEQCPALIVAPTSVIMNWHYEAKKFTPDLKVLVLHGPGRKANFGKIPEYDIVITSYALLRMDKLDLERHQFGYMVLDEAQNIKNPDAAVTKAAKGLRAYRRLALTGTPTENRPMELWSIIDFLMPGYLGSPEFFKNFIEKPILDGTAGQEVVSFLRAKTRPFILRRTKAEVEKELPPKIEAVMHVEMTNSQRRLYNQIVEEVRPRVFESVDKVGIRGASISILAALLRLRQVCNHPNSIDALKSAPGYESGKFNALKELITEALESGSKILLFAQFREMLAIIRRWLEEVGIQYSYLDGETRNRQQVVDKFNAEESQRIFLISLKAGGTGLNLAAANTVIIYDPWWNPAVESQAVDRAHRIGQKRSVMVYRMVTEESIEQKIMDLKARKSKIVDALVNENALSPRSLTRADLEQLLSPLPVDGF